MLSEKPWRPEFVLLFGAAMFAALISRFCRRATSFRFGRMVFLRRWLLLWFTLVLGGGQVFAASGRETRAYAAAVSAFHDAMWSRAETEFGQFVQKYPKSDRVAEAVLLQAEAEFQQKKHPQAIALLQAGKAAAGKFADQYVYWIGEAQFQNGDFSAAAETFVSLTRDFPESSLRLRGVVEAAGPMRGSATGGSTTRCSKTQTASSSKRRDWIPATTWLWPGSCRWKIQSTSSAIFRAWRRFMDG